MHQGLGAKNKKVSAQLKNTRSPCPQASATHAIARQASATHAIATQVSRCRKMFTDNEPETFHNRRVVAMFFVPT